MKINLNKHLGFVLLLLLLCPLFMANDCTEKETWWEPANALRDDYYGEYKVTEVWDYDSSKKDLVKRAFEDKSDAFGGAYIRVESKNHILDPDESKVSISGGKYYLYYSKVSIEIKSLNEVLDSLEQCKMVEGLYNGGLVYQYDTRCEKFEYREFGIWGFPGLGEEDFNVKYNFSDGNQLIMTFTDPAKPERNFKLVCDWDSDL